jgi:hypothetical protein
MRQLKIKRIKLKGKLAMEWLIVDQINGAVAQSEHR